jgi:hypothetical protein
MTPFRQLPSRRHVLGGAAVAVGLPFLESLGFRRFARAATCAAPRRVLVYHVPNGVYMNSWLPRGTGATYTPSPTLQQIMPIRDDVLVLTGMVNGVGVPVPTAGGAHAFGMAALLTCVQAVKTGVVNLGKSFDQVAAAAIGSCTRLPSLELGIDTREGFAEPPAPVIFNRNMSWSGPATPVPRIVSPQLAWDRLFAGFDANVSAADRLKRQAYRQSVLDRVLADSKRLQVRLGGGDQKKVDEYLSSIRDVESRIQTSATPSATMAACPVSARPDANDDFSTRVTRMHDIMALALQCDATRVISFSMGNGLSTRPYTFLGIGDGHGVTHHSGNQTAIQQSIQIDKWRLDGLVKLVQKLKGIQDGNGQSLLHNMVLYYTSEIADGNSHSQHDKPILLVGQMGGTIKTGRLLAASPYDASWTDANRAFSRCDEGGRPGCGQTQLANLYVSFLNALGVPTTSFGNSTGSIDLG